MGISTYTIEQYDKSTQGMYGRACTLFPRTLEMLDQLDLGEALHQIGLVGRGAVAYRGGKRVHGRAWEKVTNPADTYFLYNLNIWQKYSENVFREALERSDGDVSSNVKLTGFTIDDKAGDYKVTADLEEVGGKAYQVRSKYIVGADGGHSTVRALADIPFIGDHVEEKKVLHWIRMDALVRTNMPNERIGIVAIESPRHGNVLWIAEDHGRTRIGFAIPPEVYEKYGEHITEEAVKEEAIQALKPFELEFVTVDWWTLYSIGQRVAESFRKDRVLLAGDAGHTHSSGAGQGMNTGMHDAVNLGWKLAGVLKGWYTNAVLETYSHERRAVAQQLITLDKTMSALISGKIPPGYISDTTSSDPHVMFTELLEKSAQFTMGLGVHYEFNTLNKAAPFLSIEAGFRAPDVLVCRPGSQIPLRLYQVTKNHAKIWIVVFTGLPFHTHAKLKALRTHLDGAKNFCKRLTTAFNFITIIAGPGVQPDEVLGVDRFGEAFYDIDESAHARYRVAVAEGAIAVLRPDGILGFATGLGQGAELGGYLETFVERV